MVVYLQRRARHASLNALKENMTITISDKTEALAPILEHALNISNRLNATAAAVKPASQPAPTADVPAVTTPARATEVLGFVAAPLSSS